MNGQRLELTLEKGGERIDRALATAVPDLSRTQIQRLLKEGAITVNGEQVKPNFRLEGGERVQIDVPEPEKTDLIPQDIPLDIRYEDDDMLVVNKPAGMVVHPSMGHPNGTLVNAVLAHAPELAGVGGKIRPGIVHRLDKDTSGLIAVAKNDHALSYLQAQFKARTVGKLYLALVEGQVQPPAALIDAPIGRDPRRRKKMAVIRNRSSRHARTARTEYRTVTGYDDYTLVECTLHTGRTHQIRVHMAYIGYPIVGDISYGRRRQHLRLKRHFLHATELQLKRPSDEQEMTFHAELPPDLQAVLDQLND